MQLSKVLIDIWKNLTPAI